MQFLADGRIAFSGTVTGPNIGSNNDRAVWREADGGGIGLVLQRAIRLPQRPARRRSAFRRFDLLAGGGWVSRPNSATRQVLRQRAFRENQGAHSSFWFRAATRPLAFSPM